MWVFRCRRFHPHTHPWTLDPGPILKANILPTRVRAPTSTKKGSNLLRIQYFVCNHTPPNDGDALRSSKTRRRSCFSERSFRQGVLSFVPGVIGTGVNIHSVWCGEPVCLRRILYEIYGCKVGFLKGRLSEGCGISLNASYHTAVLLVVSGAFFFPTFSAHSHNRLLLRCERFGSCRCDHAVRYNHLFVQQ